MFRELLDDEGLEPWGGVRWVAVGNSPDAAHGVAVGPDDVDAAAQSIARLAAAVADGTFTARG